MLGGGIEINLIRVLIKSGILLVRCGTDIHDIVTPNEDISKRSGELVIHIFITIGKSNVEVRIVRC